MRTFELHRDNDHTGISGTGLVAQGVEFDDGVVAMRWLTEHASTVIHRDADAVIAIHGHQGQTRLVWCDGSDDG